MSLDPSDPFVRTMVGAVNAERDVRADKIIRQYQRGLLTVEEVARKLQEICDDIPIPEGL